MLLLVLCRRKWGTILDENCFMRLPVTPYRYFPASEVVDNSRHVQGIDGIIRDTASLQVMTESLGRTPTGRVSGGRARRGVVMVSRRVEGCRSAEAAAHTVRCWYPSWVVQVQIQFFAEADHVIISGSSVSRRSLTRFPFRPLPCDLIHALAPLSSPSSTRMCQRSPFACPVWLTRAPRL